MEENESLLSLPGLLFCRFNQVLRAAKQCLPPVAVAPLFIKNQHPCEIFEIHQLFQLRIGQEIEQCQAMRISRVPRSKLRSRPAGYVLPPDS